MGGVGGGARRHGGAPGLLETPPEAAAPPLPLAPPPARAQPPARRKDQIRVIFLQEASGPASREPGGVGPGAGAMRLAGAVAGAGAAGARARAGAGRRVWAGLAARARARAPAGRGRGGAGVGGGGGCPRWRWAGAAATGGAGFGGEGGGRRPPVQAERVLSEGLGSGALKAAWGSVDKPMLRVGKAGAGPTHANSLGELLAAHGLVKVRFSRPEGVDAACAVFAAAGAGVALLQRGKEVLFAANEKFEALKAEPDAEG